ncbi:MAG TPA: endonuclease/exonuclease/phosphatase family protein [Bryobacteraceae bacterium]|nr:endonuclease/exonuclease/phosphatase family protein [Bryobacteraceae bacterium]
MISFRAGTYNVHKCKGLDWRVSPARIADVIARLETDVLAVQEILLSQAEEICKRIAVPFTFGAARLYGREPYGNAVYTRFLAACHQSHNITVPGREPRQCLRVLLQLPQGNTMNFFAVHLGTSFTERPKQARQLLSGRILCAPDANTRRIVAGDFNEWTNGAATRLLSEHLQSADITMHLKRRRTYPGVFPFMHLDHIYYDDCFQLREMHLDRSKLSLIASDHLPLVATFAVR